MLRNSNWTFNTSFPIKSSKIPQFLYLHVRMCRVSSFACFHQELVWKESKERFCREVPNREPLEQLKSNQRPWAGPLGTSAGNPVSSSGAPKAPGRFSAKSTCKEQPGWASQSLCPCSCRDQPAGNTIPWPRCPSSGTPRARPYTNSVKSSTEEISLFLCPVS